MILLIKNGHVINPATETDEVADILAEDGKVVKMEKNIRDKADYVIDAKGSPIFLPTSRGKISVLT